MRCRNIKYQFFVHDVLPKCEPLARLLYIGLWCMADRMGRMEERTQKIRWQLLPSDECDIDSLLQQLEIHGFIIRYTVNEMKCIQVVNFLKHQHPHFKEPPSKIPPPEGYVDENPHKKRKPQARPRQARGRTRASPGHAQDKPQASPSDTLIPDMLITESSNDDYIKHSALSRLSANNLPQAWAEWARTDRGWSPEVMQDVWVSFRDYWQSRTGKSAQKSDWGATWRNWCRQQNIRDNGGKHAATFNHPTQGARPSKSERFKHALIDSTHQELST